MNDTDTITCTWHPDVEIRSVIVLCGPKPGRPTPLMISVDPHPNGRVVERDDGTFRMLPKRMVDADVPGPRYTVHGRRSCGPDADR